MSAIENCYRNVTGIIADVQALPRFFENYGNGLSNLRARFHRLSSTASNRFRAILYIHSYRFQSTVDYMSSSGCNSQLGNSFLSSTISNKMEALYGSSSPELNFLRKEHLERPCRAWPEAALMGLIPHWVFPFRRTSKPRRGPRPNRRGWARYGNSEV